MVTRCLTALNELDRISEKITQRHSQKRYQANAEAKLNLAKKKVAHAFQECDSVCTRTSGAEWNTAQEREKGWENLNHELRSERVNTGSASSHLPSKHQRREKPKGVRSSSKSAVVSSGSRRHVISQAKSWSNCRLENSLDRCRTGSLNNGNYVAVSPRPMSIYGRHTEAESKYRPNSWFNFTEETSMGIIDSFACDANNLKPLCYTVDKTRTKGIPKLLRHRMEVRVGQNGVVRKASEFEMAVKSQSVTGRSSERQGTTLNVKNDKERIAPLSWDEQMNWANVKCLSQKLSSPKDQQKKGLCEMQPVIFHPKEKAEELLDEVENTSTFSNAKSPAYRMYLETRTLSADRRNIVASPERLITTIGLEDVREDGDVHVQANQNIQSAHALEETCDRSVATCGVDNDWLHANSDIKEMSSNQVAMVASEKVSKKVSFDDGKREASTEDVEDIAVNTGMSSKRVLTRPRTSHERFLTAHDFSRRPSQCLRPCTAPPSSPRPCHYGDAEEVWHKLLLPINHPTTARIPASHLDSIDVKNAKEDEIAAAVEDEKHFCEVKQFTENSSETEPKMPSKLQVTFAPMSAPTRKSEGEDGNAPNRSKSAMLYRQKAYSPPPPVVIFSQSLPELPKDLPPAQALLTLRKKIREDLEQQNQDLQLDIQQLHLSRHSEDV